jgi:hypothetical protein
MTRPHTWSLPWTSRTPSFYMASPTEAMYLVSAVLENHYGDHHLEQAFHTQLKRRTMPSNCGCKGVMHVLLPPSIATPPASDRTQSYGPGHCVALAVLWSGRNSSPGLPPPTPLGWGLRRWIQSQTTHSWFSVCLSLSRRHSELMDERFLIHPTIL